MIPLRDFFSKRWKTVSGTITPFLPPSREEIGFDAPKLDVSNDQLDRSELAERAFSLLTELPIEWSVRVGLLGGWGEGKTSIANWVVAKAEQRGDVVVQLYSWKIRSDTQLWIEFAAKLLKALDERGVELEGTKTLKALIGFKNWADYPRKASEYFKTSEIAFGIIDNLLRITPEDIRKLRAKIPDRRIIVVIDDLDRADPRLIPTILLSLREVLDLPGFSFLLPFDSTAVATALANYNEAWGDGGLFLEKILDFRILLPEATADQKTAIFDEELQKHCSFIPFAAVKDVAAWLPPNPRRLKGVVRSLISLKKDAERHTKDEIDWKSILFASMIRTEHPTFYNNYTAMILAEDGANPWLRAFVSKEKQADLDRKLDDLLAESGVDDAQVRHRLRSLCIAWQKTSALGFERVRYAVHLLDRSRLLTKREYLLLLDEWVASQDPTLPSVWFEQRFGERASLDKICRELLVAMLIEYDLRLNLASEVRLESENSRVNGEASAILELMRAILAMRIPIAPSIGIKLEVFRRLLEVVLSWAAVRGNVSDRARRDDEEEFLLMLARESGESWIDFATVVAAQRQTSSLDSARHELLGKLQRAFAPAIRIAASTLLTRLNGVDDLFSNSTYADLRYEILNPQGSLWSPMGKSKADIILGRASIDDIIQKNALALLNLVQAIPSIGSSQQDIQISQQFIGNTNCISAVWNAATARPLQSKFLEELQRVRAFLIDHGASEEALPVPVWLNPT